MYPDRTCTPELRSMTKKETIPGESTAPALPRVLGRWDLTAIGVNQVVGSGIFVLPAAVAALVGAASSPLIAKVQEEIQQLEQKSPMMILAYSKGIILG